MNRHERRLKAIREEQRRLVDEYKAIWKTADKEDREPTEEERLEVEDKLKQIEVLNEEKSGVEANIKTLERVDEIGKGLGPATSGIEVDGIQDVQVKQPEIKSLGQMFVESDDFQRISDEFNDGTRREFSTKSVSLQTKGTLLEGSQVSPGTGGALASPVPDVRAGVVDKLFQRNVFADLLMSETTTENAIRYVVEGTATSGVAGVAEANLKPESTLALSTVDEPVKKLATFLPVSEETLQDAARVESYINQRLTLFVQNEEDRQIIRGGGTNDLVGIIGRSGVNIYAGGTAAGNKAVQVFKALNGVRGSAFVEPDWIAMHPSDYQDIRLLTDTAGQFFGGGPWQGPYGNGNQIGFGNQLGGATEALWGKPIYVTATVGAGTALAGSRSAASVVRRSGISVDASNSHSDYFQRNLVALRAEERLALAVYRPAAFVEIRLA